jgi:hypothetical protein
VLIRVQHCLQLAHGAAVQRYSEPRDPVHFLKNPAPDRDLSKDMMHG